MIGFTAYLLVDPEAGFGVTILMNSPFGERLPLATFALTCLAAEASGTPLPEVPEPVDRGSVRDAARFVGDLRDERGAVRIEAEGDRLTLVEGPDRSRLVPAWEGRFLVDDPARDRYPVDVVRVDGHVREAFWGPRWLRPVDAPEPPSPPHEWRSLTGVYRSWNPWAPGLEVLVRGQRLWLELLDASVDLEGSQPLAPQDDGSFAIGDPPTPSRIRFDTPIDGRATRAVLDAAPFYRAAAE